MSFLTGFAYGLGRGMGSPIGFACVVLVFALFLSPTGRTIMILIACAIGLWIKADMDADDKYRQSAEYLHFQAASAVRSTEINRIVANSNIEFFRSADHCDEDNYSPQKQIAAMAGSHTMKQLNDFCASLKKG